MSNKATAGHEPEAAPLSHAAPLPWSDVARWAGALAERIEQQNLDDMRHAAFKRALSAFMQAVDTCTLRGTETSEAVWDEFYCARRQLRLVMADSVGTQTPGAN